MTQALALAEDFTPAELHSAFSETEYGRKLDNSIRWEGYKPEHLSNQEWERLLGADVNNLRHLPLSLGLTRVFIRQSETPPESWTGPVPTEAQFSDQSKHLLEMTAITHDWGEAGEKGDILYDLKTDEDEAEEVHVFNMILDQLLPAEEHPEFTEVRERIIEIMDYKNRPTPLGAAFNAIERLGYVRTAFQARRISHTSRVDPLTEEHLTIMTRDTLAYQTRHLVAYSETFPAVNEFLVRNRTAFLSTFETLQDLGIKAGVPSAENIQDQFKNARELYQQWNSIDGSRATP